MKCHPSKKFQAKEEIVGFCEADPSICVLPSWGGCIVCHVRRGRGEDLHVHGGANQNNDNTFRRKFVFKETVHGGAKEIF